MRPANVWNNACKQIYAVRELNVCLKCHRDESVALKPRTFIVFSDL